MDRLHDIDPLETREWVDSLDSVLEIEGPERAHFLLEQLVDKARRSGAYLPYSAQHRVHQHDPAAPGGALARATRSSKHRMRSMVRWNAVAMVLRAGKKDLELGGHIASFSSAATLYDVGFNHFWHAPTEEHGGDLIYYPGPLLAGRLRARLPRGTAHRGAARQVPPGSRRQGHLQLPASRGSCPTSGSSRRCRWAWARCRRSTRRASCTTSRTAGMRQDRGPQGLGLHGRRRDGRARVAGRHRHGLARGPRQPDLRRELQPAAPRRPGARQRQDHPGARGRVPRRRLERDQGDLGLATGTR